MLILTEEDITTKDGRILSPKQLKCLYRYSRLDLGKTLRYIQDNNYKEISKAIGTYLANVIKYSQKHIRRCECDRGFDDDPFYEYHCPYSEGDLC